MRMRAGRRCPNLPCMTTRYLESTRERAEQLLRSRYLTDGRRLFRVISSSNPAFELSFATLEDCLTLAVRTYTAEDMLALAMRPVHAGAALD